ncbi:RNA polymerase sigma factor [Streptomyces sp. NPDC058231]|uniref:RNA polymerase sigma factor n=1 Tax=Streptomyces sp. NPDC058231 TaxID=3346392 RepID=UPI0036EE6EFC
MYERYPEQRSRSRVEAPAAAPADDEAAVIARVRAGEPEAYAQLVRAHTGVALRAAVAFGAGAEAEDVVQSAFFKAYRSLGRFREGSAFRPWLLRIVVNETRNTLRSAGRARAVAGREAMMRGAEPVIPESADPAVAALAEERRTLLTAALGELSKEQRQVVTYRYLLEMDEAETAQTLGWPRGTVKSRLNRALKKLEKRLGAPVDGREAEGDDGDE